MSVFRPTTRKNTPDRGLLEPPFFALCSAYHMRHKALRPRYDAPNTFPDHPIGRIRFISSKFSCLRYATGLFPFFLVFFSTPVQGPVRTPTQPDQSILLTMSFQNHHRFAVFRPSPLVLHASKVSGFFGLFPLEFPEIGGKSAKSAQNRMFSDPNSC